MSPLRLDSFEADHRWIYYAVIGLVMGAVILATLYASGLVA